MATETAQAIAEQTQPETATTTSPEAVVDTLSTTEGPETGSPKVTTPVNAFKGKTADELAQIQDGFRVKVSEGKVKVGHDATLNVTRPKGDNLPIEEAPAEQAPEKMESTEAKVETTEKDPTPTETEIDPESDDAPAPTNGKTPQRRLRLDGDPLGDAAAALVQSAQRNGRKLLMEDALKAVREAYKDESIAQPAVKGLDALQAELATLRTQRKEAKAAFDVDVEDSAQNAIEDKLLEIDRTERAMLAAQQQEHAQAIKIEASAIAEAARLYPDLKNDGKEGRSESEMHKAAKAIHAALVASRDPAVHQPDYLLDLARRAAKVTSTPPATVNGTKPAAKPVSRPSVTQPAKAPLVTSGAARTSPTSQATSLSAGIKKLSSRQLETLQDNLRTAIERRR